MKRTHGWIVMLAVLGMAGAAWPMELVWTAMTGQYSSDGTPLVADLNGDGAPELVYVNRQGQVLHCAIDGSPLGAGSDGIAAQLPEGRWTSQPVWWRERLVFGGVEGKIAALDKNFKPLWEHSLGEETAWSRAVGVPVPGHEDRLVFGDLSGKITCLNPDGGVVWVRDLQRGPCRAPLQTLVHPDGRMLLLAACGDSLSCLDADGQTVWLRPLQAPVLSQPEVLALPDRTLIVCGAGAGALYALSPDGEVRWSAEVGSEIDSTIVFLPRENTSPLIACTGLWGNLHAFDTEGKPVWQHQFKAKNRAKPALADVDGDGRQDIVVATYRQELLAVNQEGRRIDQVRLGGSVNASPLVLRDLAANADRIIVLTTAMTLHAYAPSPVKPVYGASEAAEILLTVTPVAASAPAIQIQNPAGALLRVHMATDLPSKARRVDSWLTARTLAEFTARDSSAATMDVRVENVAGAVLFEKSLAAVPRLAAAAGGGLGMTAVDPYGGLDCSLPENQVQIDALYQGETGQGAFRVAWGQNTPMRARFAVQTPVREDGTRFTGSLRLFEVAATGTLNGENALDALMDLGDSGLMTLLPGEPGLVWVQAQAGGTAPGEYTGKVVAYPLMGEASNTEIELRISVPDLQMPRDNPLTLCTWDYIPNQWFPERAAEVLEGMRGHGVDVFPRTIAPAATLNSAGELGIDWGKLDEELARIGASGEVLFHIGRPGIAWPENFPEEQKRAKEIEYLLAFRDHLKAAGWDYHRYAFYPVDEPGLDFGKNTVPILVQAAELIRAADPQFRIYTDPVPTLSRADFERIEPLIDVWCPNMRLVTGLLAGDPRMRRIMDSGKTVWSYECESQVRSLSPLVYNRANAWRAWHFGLDGIGMWTFSTTQEDHWPDRDARKEEYALVYPGVLPVSSVRWEALRDGVEDVAALSLLKAAVEAQRSNEGKRELVAQAEALLRNAAVDVMELSDEAYVETRDFLAPGERRVWHTNTDATNFVRHRKAVAELTLALRP